MRSNESESEIWAAFQTDDNDDDNDDVDDEHNDTVAAKLRKLCV